MNPTDTLETDSEALDTESFALDHAVDTDVADTDSDTDVADDTDVITEAVGTEATEVVGTIDPRGALNAPAEPLGVEPLLGAGLVLATIAYVGTLGVKQALFRAGRIETPWSRQVLQGSPIVIGLGLAQYVWGWTIDLQWGGGIIPIPSLLFGAIAGRFSEAGYMLVRERFKWLDAVTLSSDGPTRQRAGGLSTALRRDADQREAEKRAARDGGDA